MARYTDGSYEVRVGVHNLARQVREELNEEEIGYLEQIGRDIIVENP